MLHKARKRFGQNFLVDQSVINNIVRAIRPRPDDRLVEIGPGQGALTAPLLEGCEQLQVIELDRDLIPTLLAQFAKYPQFKIHQADALKFDFGALIQAQEKLRIVGNLPYNISTPLLFHLLEYEHCIQDMHFMLQKEVVLRLAAQPGDKNYGRLSVMAQYYCDISYLFDVPPESFRPAPKVDSAIVRLIPHLNKPAVAKDIQHLEQLVAAAFQQRRKTLRNALKNYALEIEARKTRIAIDFSLRAENLALSDYVNLSNRLLEPVD